MNNSWARKTVQTGAIAAGAVLVAGAGTAHAYGPDVETSDQVGAVTGNQVVAPVQVPINICGVAAAVLGTSSAGCEGGAEATFDGLGGTDLTTENNTGLINGNQAYAPIQVPAEVSSIAAAVGGTATAWSDGGSSASIPESGRHAEAADVTTQDNVGLLSGNQLLAPIQAPINACGNAVAIGGGAAAGCEGGAEAEYDGLGGTDLTSQDNVGLGNGNQVFAPIQAPVNVCGNAIAILGTAVASCEGGSEADVDEPDDHHESHKYAESSTVEAANVDVSEEQLPTGGVPGLDTATDLAGGLPVVGGLTGGLGSNVTPEDVASTATDTVAGATQLAGTGLL